MPKNTQNTTLFAVNLYNKWREYHRGLGNRYAPLDCGVPEILNQAIPKCLYEIRRKDGQQYHPDSVKSIFFGINRYLTESDATMNVMESPEFLVCRQKVDGLIKQLQSTKPPQKKQAAAIDPIRQAELWESGVLGPSTPLSLVDAVIWQCGRLFAFQILQLQRNRENRRATKR